MSSRSCSPSSPEPHGNSSHRDGNQSPPQLPDSTHASQPRPRSPDSSSRHSKSQPRKSSDHSSHSRSSRKHHKRSRSRSKSPHRRHEPGKPSSRRSRTRSKSPGVRQGHSSSTRKSRSRSRSESPPHNRRTHATRPHSRSPPVHKRREHTRSSHKSRSRSKSPSQSRRDSGSAKQARSRSRSPVYNKRFGNRDYKPHGYSGNRRGGSDKPFRGRQETAQYYRTGATPIAKLPSETNTTTTSNKPATPSAPSAEDLGLTPEQKLERALQAAQALNPKLSAPGPSVSVLSSMSASVGLNTYGGSPAALQKKKLLWNKKSADNKWEGVSFGEEGDDEAQAKFRRLMGMKKPPSTQASSNVSAQAVSSDGSKMKEKHEKLFKDLQQQYETSRFMTHLARGSGLGYGTSSPSGDSTQ